MPHTKPVTTEITVSMRRVYQLSSLVWTVYSAALALAVYGSVLLKFAEPGRLVLTTLAAIVSIGMVIRAFAPNRPEWTRWTLPVIGGTSVATFTLLLFASDFAGGFTPARVGFSLLVLTPGGIAYVHYVGEKVMAPR